MHLSKTIVVTGIVVWVFLLSSCSHLMPTPVVKDSAPLHSIDPEKIKDAIPRRDLITRAGNKNPYTVLGKTYHLLPSSKGYREAGVASWYGTKFHGRPTANGELYNLYSMTAAHKTLPIPSYVKVTNLDNKRSTIVRVNDRGPFHDYRVIDLSYAAAVKLGYAEQGTAKVLVEAIEPEDTLKTTSTKAEVSGHYFLQVAAFKNLEAANALRAKLLLDVNGKVIVTASEPTGFYRVQLGPLSSLEQVRLVSEQLQRLDLGQPQLISQ